MRGSSSARRFSDRNSCDASTTSGEISTTSAAAIGWASADANVMPLPKSDDADPPRVPVQEERQVRERLLRQHVAAGRRVDLAVDGERQVAGEPLDGHDAGRTFAVVQQRSGFQRGRQVEALRDVACVLVSSARQQRAIPARTRERRQPRLRRPIRQPGEAAAPGRAPAATTTRAPPISTDIGQPERVLQPEGRQQQKAGGQRTAD